MNISKYVTPPRIGKTSFMATVDRSRGQCLDVPCLQCGAAFRRGLVAWTFLVGSELVGYVCPRCLTDAARAKVEARAASVKQ